MGYTLFDAKVVPWNGKMNWLRFKTKYDGIIRYDNIEESNFRNDLNAKVKAARDAGTMCRNCTKPWNLADVSCIVGENGLKTSLKKHKILK